jgi:hypothetical protein
VLQGVIDGANIAVIGSGRDLIRTSFEHVQDAQSGPGTDSKERSVDLSQCMKPIHGWVDPAIEGNVGRSNRIAPLITASQDALTGDGVLTESRG